MEGLKMTPGTVVAGLDTMNINLNKVINDAQKMMCEISELESTADELVGESYDSIRTYYSSVHTAVMRAVILHAEAMIQENNTYKNCISGYLTGIGYVNEEKLKEERELLDERIRMAYQLVYASKCSSYSSWIGSMESALRLIDKKLDQIDAFKTATEGLYQTIDAYENTLKMGIESISSSIFDGKNISYPVDYIDRGWKADVDQQWAEREQKRIENIKEPFIKNMETHFGFDRETSEILYRLYDELDMRGEENIDQKFFLMLGSITYPYEGTVSRDLMLVPKNLNDLWYALVGTYRTEKLNEELKRYGLSEYEIEKLEADVKNNHEHKLGDSAYIGKADLGHMSIIMALLLSKEENAWTDMGDVAGVFNGIYNLEANAGYVGDVYGTGGNGPKLTQDDYKADLDAVNLSARIKAGGSVPGVMNEYYTGIIVGDVNRADEFATNLGNGSREAGIEILEAQRERHEIYIQNYILTDQAMNTFLMDCMYDAIEEKKHIHITEEEWEERRKIVDYFIEAVSNSMNEYVYEDNVDVSFAETGIREE